MKLSEKVMNNLKEIGLELDIEKKRKHISELMECLNKTSNTDHPGYKRLKKAVWQMVVKKQELERKLKEEKRKRIQ